MWASIVPGLREVRTPLVVGYVYLLTLWLAFGRNLEIDPSETILVSRYRDLTEFFGPAAVVTSLSFVAYLLGSVVVTSQRDFGRPERASATSVAGWIAARAAYLHNRGMTLGQLEETNDPDLEQLRQAIYSSGSKDDNLRTLEYALTAALPHEFDVLAIRMQIEHQALWNEYDRLRSEGELRLGLFRPLLLLAIVLMLLWTPFSIIFVALPLLLRRQGRKQQYAANAKVWTALATNVIESPTVVRMEKLLADDPLTNEPRSVEDQAV